MPPPPERDLTPPHTPAPTAPHHEVGAGVGVGVRECVGGRGHALGGGGWEPPPHLIVVAVRCLFPQTTSIEALQSLPAARQTTYI